MSHLATQFNSARDAVRIADAGLVRARDAEGVPRLQARLFALRARGFALDGQSRACADSLRVAEEILEDSREEAPAEWIANFDDGSLASEAALCFQSLGDLGGAERHALRAIELRNGDRVRSRAFAQLTLASVLVGDGRVAEAAAIGALVCVLLPVLSSARVVAGLTELASSLQPYATVTEVRDLLEQWKDFTSLSEPEPERELWPV